MKIRTMLVLVAAMAATGCEKKPSIYDLMGFCDHLRAPPSAGPVAQLDESFAFLTQKTSNETTAPIIAKLAAVGPNEKPRVFLKWAKHWYPHYECDALMTHWQ
jgi:hypothetical protein